MAIAILKFNLDHENEQFQQALNAPDVFLALEEIHQKVWRPAYKHGYEDSSFTAEIQKINAAIEKLNVKNAEGEQASVEDLIYKLMLKYNEILKEYGVKLN